MAFWGGITNFKAPLDADAEYVQNSFTTPSSIFFGGQYNFKAPHLTLYFSTKIGVSPCAGPHSSDPEGWRWGPEWHGWIET